MLQIALDLHNMSNSKTELVRTGIQEVSFQILRILVQTGGRCVDSTSGQSVRVVPILSMTHDSSATLPDFFFPTYFANSPKVLDLALQSLGKSRQEFLLDFPECAGFFSEDTSLIWRTIEEILLQSSAYLSVPLCDVRHVFEHGRRINPSCRFGQIVHDVGPAVRPEFVVSELRSWFMTQGIENFRESDFLISVSRFTAQEVEAFIGRRQDSLSANNRFVVLPSESNPNPNESLDQQILTKYGLESKHYFLSAGTIEPRKNTLLTIRGYALYRQRYGVEGKVPALPLVITGSSGWLNEHVLAEFSGSHVKEHMKILGFVSDEELVVLTRNATVLCFPSHYEGFGIPPARAIGFGTPVITTAMSSLPEACDSQCFFVASDDPQGLAAALAASIALPMHSPGHGRAGAHSTLRTWSNYLDDLVSQIVESIVTFQRSSMPGPQESPSPHEVIPFAQRCLKAGLAVDFSPGSLFHQFPDALGRLQKLKAASTVRVSLLMLPALVTDARLQDSRKGFRDPAERVTQSVLALSSSATLSDLDIDARVLLIEPRSLTVAVYESGLFLCASPTRLDDMRDIQLLRDWQGFLICVDHPSFDDHPNIRAARRSFERFADLILTHSAKNYAIGAAPRIIEHPNPLMAAVTLVEDSLRTYETRIQKAHEEPYFCDHRTL